MGVTGRKLLRVVVGAWVLTWDLVDDLEHLVPGYWLWGAATATAAQLWGLVPGAIVGALLAAASILGHVFVGPELRARRRVRRLVAADAVRSLPRPVAVPESAAA